MIKTTTIVGHEEIISLAENKNIKIIIESNFKPDVYENANIYYHDTGNIIEIRTDAEASGAFYRLDEVKKITYTDDEPEDCKYCKYENYGVYDDPCRHCCHCKASMFKRKEPATNEEEKTI